MNKLNRKRLDFYTAPPSKPAAHCSSQIDTDMWYLKCQLSFVHLEPTSKLVAGKRALVHDVSISDSLVPSALSLPSSPCREKKKALGEESYKTLSCGA